MAMNIELIDVLNQAVNHFGAENQKQQCIEECAELIDALCKERRGRNTEDDVITEIADVMIMCRQLAQIYGPDKVDKEIVLKINRLKERMNL